MKKINLRTLASILIVAAVSGCGDKSAEVPGTRREDGSADVARGMLELSRGNATAAETAFAAAARTCETNLDAQVQLALVRLRLGKAADAQAAAAAALALCPESAEARLAHGQAAYLKKDYKTALTDFAAVAGEQSLPKTMRASAWASRGVVELAQNRREEARISFLHARRLHYRCASAWYHLGVIMRDLYHWDSEARESFAVAGKMLDAKDERTVKIVRDILPSLDKSISAAAASRPGVASRRPQAAAKLIAEGRRLQSEKKPASLAVKKYEAAMAADPLSPQAAQCCAELRAQSAKTSEDIDKTLAAYHALIDNDSMKTSHYIDAARFAYKHGRWSTTVAILNRALAHDPDNRQALDLIVAALRKAGRRALANEWDAYRSNPN